VDVKGGMNAGVVFANPSSSDAVIAFHFTDAAGRDFGNGSFTLGAKRQLSGFLTEAPFNLRDPIEGTFSFRSSQSVAVTALRTLTNQRNEFIMTTLPVFTEVDSGSLAVLPHFAVGGGWTTKLALVNPTNSVLKGRAEFMSPGSQDSAAAPIAVITNGGTVLNFS